MTVIRKVVGDHFENFETISVEWELRPQIEVLEAWLSEHANKLDADHAWVADIGFNHRPRSFGGGPPISRRLMQMCIDANLEIYLSEYGLDEEN